MNAELLALLQEDIYTDAHEYADRVARVQVLVRLESITPTDWMRIMLALKSYLKSPTVQGNDRESLDWRRHLRDIRQAITDGEQASLNREDWAEIFYSLRDESEEDLRRKIGPDGLYMVVDHADDI